MPLFQRETKAGEPIQAGEVTIIPFAENIRISVPGWLGGIIWNRPTAIAVQTTDGEEHILPVVDATRQMQIIIILAGLTSALLIWLISQVIPIKRNA
jgi:hypothetical protein